MRYLVVAPLLAMLAACAADEPPPPPKETVFDPMLHQRDRVKEMADKLPQERKDNLDQAIESGAE